jgi:isopentenyldiphosphate isomerase
MSSIEKVQLVDDRDTVIGHKTRQELDYCADGVDRIRLSALMLTAPVMRRRHRMRVLITQRANTPGIEDPLLWSPSAAGKLEGDETYQENIVNELDQELGVTLKQPPTLEEKYRIDDPRRMFVTVFRANQFIPVRRMKLDPKEVKGAAWVESEWLENSVKENPDQYVHYMWAFLPLIHMWADEDAPAHFLPYPLSELRRRFL